MHFAQGKLIGEKLQANSNRQTSRATVTNEILSSKFAQLFLADPKKKKKKRNDANQDRSLKLFY